jgi:hypothetical protein
LICDLPIDVQHVARKPWAYVVIGAGAGLVLAVWLVRRSRAEDRSLIRPENRRKPPVTGDAGGAAAARATVTAHLARLPKPRPGYVRVLRGQTRVYDTMRPSGLRGSTPPANEQLFRVYGHLAAASLSDSPEQMSGHSSRVGRCGRTPLRSSTDLGPGFSM